MKKKIVMTTVLTALCLSFTACGAKETTAEPTAETVIAETVVETTEAATEEAAVEETTTEETTETTEATTEEVAKDNEIATVAEAVKTAVAHKDIEALADLVAYPAYVDIEEGAVVETKEGFIAIGAEAIFTDELVDTIANVDVQTLSEVEAGVIMSGKEGRPNITLGTNEEGTFGITGINYQ